MLYNTVYKMSTLDISPYQQNMVAC